MTARYLIGPERPEKAPRYGVRVPNDDEAALAFLVAAFEIDAPHSIRPANRVLDSAPARRVIARAEVMHVQGVEGRMGAPCDAVGEERAVVRRVRVS